MQKKPSTKLHLSKETLRSLTKKEEVLVVGGATFNKSICLSCPTHCC